MPVLEKHFGTDKYSVVYLVDEDQDNMRLDQFLQLYLKTFSRQIVKKKIKDGEVTIKSRPGTPRPSSRVKHKDIVTLEIHKTEHEDEYWNGEKLKLELEPKILYEDDKLVVISKPPYMATHPTGRHLFNAATVFLENKYKKTVHSIHRIDRETSGVLMLGREPKITAKMTEHFENDQIRKCYFFIGVTNEDYKGEKRFSAHERLGTEEKGLKRVYINHYPENSTAGKRATTHFYIGLEQNGYVLGLAFPQTGRQHQIRVHALAHGFPLLGDKIYFGSYEMFQRFKDLKASQDDHELMEISRQALHAMALNVPYEGARKTFTSPLPHDLRDWIGRKMDITISEIENHFQKEIDDYFKRSCK